MTNILSLWEFLRLAENLPTYGPPHSIELTGDHIVDLFQRLSGKIETTAKLISKEAIKNVRNLSGSSIYSNLNNRNSNHFKAAAITEIFRSGRFLSLPSGHFTSNPSHIDTIILQNNIHEALSTEALIFELAWGQAKRDAGYLKTPGFGADLGELIALIRIATIMRTAHYILDGKKSVRVRIITGGQRFFQAFFTNPERDEIYNTQRKYFVSSLGYSDTITFESIDRYYSMQEIEKRLDEIEITSEPVISGWKNIQFRSALLSIDWNYIFENNNLMPHGLSRPNNLHNCFQNLSFPDRQVLLRYVLSSIINPSIDFSPVIELGFDYFFIQEAQAWIERVTRFSSQKYALLGQLTNRSPSNSESTIKFSVIDKQEKTTVPTLFLLGKRHGVTLPQHVTPVLISDSNPSISYYTYVEVVNSANPIYISISADSSHSLHWLGDQRQPFFLAIGSLEEIIQSVVDASL
jgi:hypothetical protein